MDRSNPRTRLLRLAAWTVLVWGVAGVSAVWAQEGQIQEGPAAPAVNFWYELFVNLFNSRKLMELLGRREFAVPAFLALNLIVFVETGLLIGFCLPGDSLLVTAGLVACGSDWNLALLLVTLCISAIVGDSVGYSIGWKSGPRIFNRQSSFFFNKDHLLKAQAFYEKHGGKTIILARFVPIVRTFAPVVAGVGRMGYRRFLFYNVIGGIGWVVSLTLLGYSLPGIINPLLRPIFGEQFEVQDHVEKVILLVVFLSILPMLIAAARHKLAGKAPLAENDGSASPPTPASPATVDAP